MGGNKKIRKQNQQQAASKAKTELLPFVSICTPTFNRRPFIPSMIKCFEHQTYPKDRMEWIIIDDGTDKIGDMVSHLPNVRYFECMEKLSLGKKRNMMNSKATGEILVYMDDDDYYPPERVSHAVETLQKNPTADCVGSSEMYVYFKHINQMYKFGPYHATHATAATFAFRRRLLSKTKFEEGACVAEERKFLLDWTIPFAQLDPRKTILVFSHNQNSFDKKELLRTPNHMMSVSPLKPSDFVKEPDLLQFFVEDINVLLDAYKPGDISNKPDVMRQIEEIKIKRAKMEEEMRQKNIITSPQEAQAKLNEFMARIQALEAEVIRLTGENKQLMEKAKYANDKMRDVIAERIQEKKLLQATQLEVTQLQEKLLQWQQQSSPQQEPPQPPKEPSVAVTGGESKVDATGWTIVVNETPVVSPPPPPSPTPCEESEM
jgi:glycosyltransferase involved in cell wall biosynthesis